MSVPGPTSPLPPPPDTVIGAGAAAAAADPLPSLIERMAARDEAALGDFYERCVATVFGLVLRIVRQRAVAEEVVADAFLQAWQQAARYDASRGRPLAWVLTIARTRAIDALRRTDPAEQVEDAAALADEVAQSAGLPGCGAPDDPLALLDGGRRDRELHRALEQLAPVQRQVIALAYFRGLSQSEIAAHLGIPLGTVKSHTRFALQTLRRELGPQLADEDN